MPWCGRLGRGETPKKFVRMADAVQRSLHTHRCEALEQLAEQFAEQLASETARPIVSSTATRLYAKSAPRLARQAAMS